MKVLNDSKFCTIVRRWDKNKQDVLGLRLKKHDFALVRLLKVWVKKAFNVQASVTRPIKCFCFRTLIKIHSDSSPVEFSKCCAKCNKIEKTVALRCTDFFWLLTELLHNNLKSNMKEHADFYLMIPK